MQRNLAHCGAVAHGQSHDVRGDQHAAARVDVESPAVMPRVSMCWIGVGSPVEGSIE